MVHTDVIVNFMAGAFILCANTHFLQIVVRLRTQFQSNTDLLWLEIGNEHINQFR